MEPTYADGDWLLVEHASGSRPIGRGDVVVARRDDRLVSHRVVGLRDGVALTRGDACAHTDPPIPMGELIGRVVGTRRGRGVRSRLRRARQSIGRFLAAPSGGSDD